MEAYMTRYNPAGMVSSQANNRQYAPMTDRKNSNLNQFQFQGGGNSGRVVASTIDLSSDEEIATSDDDKVIEVKGYGTMRASQLEELIVRLADEIQEMVGRGVYKVGDKADLLKLFADTYSRLNQ